MTDNGEMYGLIVEMVDQGPILMELEDMSLDGVQRAYDRWVGQPKTVRVCIVRLIYHRGNATLCPTPKPNEEPAF
jgi:hypothetical protein